MPAPTEFRWTRAALHAGLAALVVGLVAVVLVATVDIADPRRFGEGVGRFVAFVALGAVGASWLAQTGRRRWAAVVVVVLAGLAAAVAVMVVSLAGWRGGVTTTLPADDLERAGERLRHPSLRFSIPDPGPTFVLRPELAATYSQGPEVRAWAYADQAARAYVVVLLYTRVARSEHSFASFFAGLLAGQVEAMDRIGMAHEERERSVDRAARRAHAHVVVGGGDLHLRADAFGLAGGVALVIMSGAPEPTLFADLAGGVELPEPGVGE